jgi:hypothetical protein
MEKSDRARFDHCVTGYGAEITSGSDAETRLQIVRDSLSDPVATVHCRSADNISEFARKGIIAADRDPPDSPSLGHFMRAWSGNSSSLVLHEFDSLNPDLQRDVAQGMKGLAEQLDKENNLMIAYTCAERGSVVHAEPDLRGRVQTFDIDDY